MKTYDDFAKQVEILETDEGYMVLDTDCDEYMHDDTGDNCFTSYTYALKMAHDLIMTRLEHQDSSNT
jgi:hypothetical protein